MQVTMFVFILWIYQTEAYTCTSYCSDQCHCRKSTATVSCEGVNGAIPQCLPKDIEELVISNSREFTLLSEFDLIRYERLKRLSIVKTGLTEIHGNAFKDLRDLTTIEIKYAPYLRKLPRGIFSGKSKLQTISIEFCPSLRTLRHGIFKNLTNLQVLNLGSNAIQQVDEDMLHLSPNVTSIDLSNNNQLEDLPRYVFSELGKLRSLALSNCSLRVLYPEHAKTPCGSGSLSTFDGRHNLWQCDDMQEFIAWIQATPHFSDFAKIGTCSTPELLQNQNVLSLPLHQVDSSRNNLSFATAAYTSTTSTRARTSTSKSNEAAEAKSSQTWISIAVITIVVICLIIFLLAAKICSCCCRSSNASSQSRPSGAVMIAYPRPTRNYRNQGFDESEVPAQLANESILQSDCNVGNWTINSIAPPSYEDVVGDGMGHNRRQDINKTPNTIAEIEETAPPPYDGAKDA